MSEDGIVYRSSEDTAKRWGISDRRVRVLCENGQVEGAVRNGKLWKIPQSAMKPRDGRTMRALGIPVGLRGRIAEIDALKDQLAADQLNTGTRYYDKLRYNLWWLKHALQAELKTAILPTNHKKVLA